MKRIMVLCLVMALLATMTIGVSATTITPGEYIATANKFTVEINVGTVNAGKMFGFVAVPAGEAIAQENIVYIDQATADSNGIIKFENFAPKGAAPSDTANWKNCDLYIGGGDLNAATKAGILKAVAANPTTVKITGTVKDTLAGADKDATVTVYDTNKNVVGTPATVVKKGDGKFSIDVPVGTYSVVVTKPSFLSYTITGVSATADVKVGGDAGIDISGLGGDIDGSEQVIFSDLQAVLTDYLKETTELANPNSDIDGSGQVIFRDLQALLGAYLKTATVVPFN